MDVSQNASVADSGASRPWVEILISAGRGSRQTLTSKFALPDPCGVHASPDDLLAVNRLLLDLYRAPTPDEHVQAMLRVMAELVPSDVIGWNEYNLKANTLRFTAFPPVWPALAKRLESVGLYAHQSPFPAYFGASGDRSWRMITDFIPIEEFAKTDFCSRILMPDMGPHQIGTVLHEVGGIMNAFTLNRIHSPFSERDREVLNLLYPHLSLSYSNVRALNEARHSTQMLQQVVEAAPAGYLFLSDSGSPQWMTQKARDIFRQHCADEVSDGGGIPNSVSTWMRQAVRRIKQGDYLNAAYVQRKPDPGPRLEARLLPARLAGWIMVVEAHPAQARPRFHPDPTLTGRENEVLRWMTEGKRNQEIAVILGISPRTVERHVASVLEKMNVENRASAIVSAMTKTAQTAKTDRQLRPPGTS